MKRYFFISGLPRSKSTLLSAILKQNPEFYSNISSPLEALTKVSIDLFSESENNFLIDEEVRKNTIKGIFDGYYKNIESPIIFDTSNLWTKSSSIIRSIFPYTKILCTVRDISLILNSFESLFQKNCLYSKRINEEHFSDDVFQRTEQMFERNVLYFCSYLLESYYRNPDIIHLIEYENLCKYPEKTMKSVYEHIGLPYYEHDFECLDYSNKIFDLSCNVKDLHTVRKKVEYIPHKIILPPQIIEKYNDMNLEFWRQ